MQPLDLRLRPPRGPREKLGGLFMLARTVDKLRARLPGGNMGEYHVSFGLSKHMADALGIDLQQLGEVVKEAQTDDDVAGWVCEHSDPAKYDDINRSLEERTQTRNIPAELRGRFESKYAPEVRAAHDNLFDLVEADDRHCYARQ